MWGPPHTRDVPKVGVRDPGSRTAGPQAPRGLDPWPDPAAREVRGLDAGPNADSSALRSDRCVLLPYPRLRKRDAKKPSIPDMSGFSCPHWFGRVRKSP